MSRRVDNRPSRIRRAAIPAAALAALALAGCTENNATPNGNSSVASHEQLSSTTVESPALRAEITQNTITIGNAIATLATDKDRGLQYVAVPHSIVTATNVGIMPRGQAGAFTIEYKVGDEHDGQLTIAESSARDVVGNRGVAYPSDSGFQLVMNVRGTTADNLRSMTIAQNMQDYKTPGIATFKQVMNTLSGGTDSANLSVASVMIANSEGSASMTLSGNSITYANHGFGSELPATFAGNTTVQQFNDLAADFTSALEK